MSDQQHIITVNYGCTKLPSSDDEPETPRHRHASNPFPRAPVQISKLARCVDGLIFLSAVLTSICLIVAICELLISHCTTRGSHNDH